MRTLTVDLGDRSYPIHIGAGLIGNPALLAPHLGREVAVVTNETVARHYLEPLCAALPASAKVSRIILRDGEQYKTLGELEVVFDTLLRDRHGRGTTLIALGGGVVGDMTGFAAACYQRGAAFVQMPTTLLAQVDSSVGGKTGVNHARGKNMIGAFHQPRCVVADTDVLSTLPAREYAAGLAEVFKYGLICDADFYRWLVAHIDALSAREPAALTDAIYRSCVNKARVVAADEREGGVRAILNLGHTFGHAIETAQGYGSWLHGEAVAVGMLLAADLSARLGWLGSGAVADLRTLLIRAGLPVRPPGDMTADVFLEHMAVDKKVIDGQLRLVLLKAVGDAVVTADFPTQLLRQCLDDALTGSL